MGRTYVKVDQRPTDDAGYDEWVRNIKKGRLYCGDGRSHFLAFSVNGHSSGDADVELGHAGEVTINATVAARLSDEPVADMSILPDWHLERGRLGTKREVEVEVVVNGMAVEKARIVADGLPHTLKFRVRIARSSWIAMRILPSGHSHPVFVVVDRKAIRASRRSAQWCRASVDKVWEVKSPYIREVERAAAASAYDHARMTYDLIVPESP
jgi:hypothetical protein